MVKLDTPAHKIIRLDNLSTNDTVDLTSELIKNDYIAYYDGVVTGAVVTAAVVKNTNKKG